jgi:hypothetical protein
MKPSDQFGLDALLGRWPAQEPQGKGGASWDERADVIVAAALARKDQGSPDLTEALLASPSLEAEPGEEKASSGFQLVDAASISRPQSQSGAPQPMSNDQSKKPSLKELAARASARGSIPPGSSTSTPPPVRISTVPGIGATVTPISKARSARPSDPGREDSGVLRLADLQAQEAQKAEAAAVAAEAALAAAKQVSLAPAPVTAKPAPVAANSGNKSGMWAGVAIGVLGIAAAFAVYRTRQPDTAPARTEAQAPAKPTQQAIVAAPTAKAEATAEPAAVASSDATPASSGAAKVDPAQGAGGQGPAPSATAVAGNETKPATPALKGSKVGTLDEEMKKAVGTNESQPAPQDESKPASGSNSGNLPDQPSQGNAQAAVRSVLPAAKACVAGATEPSSASITFGSSGSVQSVSVGGWAAANGKAGCVKSALQGAHVSPFAKPTFTVPANIRP